MKKFFALLFTALCLVICVVPSLGMIVAPTYEPVGNEQASQMPSLTNDDGSFNNRYPSQLGDYFTQHFAFRPEMITLDAKIQSTAFKTSNLDTVTVGSKDWLYYSATLNDHLGKDQLSQRQINGIVHNLLLAQEYTESAGGKFLFTVAPNKNTLYPENMPYYYSQQASSRHNRDALTQAISGSGLNYCDLFSVFKAQSDVLYLRQDSHWDNRGALLAYNSILDAVGKPHDDYSGVQPERSNDFYGDLQNMLYPADQKPEVNFNYDIGQTYSYVTPTKSVEEAIIKTENAAQTGSLYMYRDSFGNALLPFFANAYGSAYFTKAFPVNLAIDTTTSKADTVIFEIAERNISWFVEDPPVMPSPERTITVGSDKSGELEYPLTAQLSEVNMQYIDLCGSLDGVIHGDNSVVYLRVSGDGCPIRIYEAFDYLTDDGDGYLAYIPVECYAGKQLNVDVIIGTNGSYMVYSGTADTSCITQPTSK